MCTYAYFHVKSTKMTQKLNIKCRSGVAKPKQTCHKYLIVPRIYNCAQKKIMQGKKKSKVRKARVLIEKPYDWK